MGVGLVADGTGIVLNNELDDFSAKPGVPNAFGLIGGAANAPGPGKRPLSSMSPTIVLQKESRSWQPARPGAAGSSTPCLKSIVNTLDGHMGIGNAVAAPRFHDQWLPDEVVVEPNFPPAKIRGLAALGHNIQVNSLFGSAHSIEVTPNGLVGAADQRARGSFAAGY